ncbi:MAG: hypothetical protein LWY06_10550 [Firmicutes bacterium]|nr:hypothetical protein [Bacillota bacterium]
MKRACLLVSILVFIAMATIQVFASNSGLLIGLRRDAPEKTVGAASKYELGPSYLYRTLWIYPSGETYKALEMKNIILPRDRGFWEVGTITPSQKEWSEDQVYAVPFGKKPTAKLTVNPENTNGNISVCILFVGNNYIGISGETGGYTKGAAHPWAGNFLNTLSVDNVKKKVEIQDALGTNALTALKKSAAEYRQNHPDEKEKLYEEAQDSSWALIRRNGSWVVRGFLDYSYEVFRGHYAHFDVPVRIPRELVSHDELVIPWNSIRKAIPDAIDACSSPSGDMLAVVTSNRILVFRKDGKVDFKKPSFSRSLWNESPVMIQWAADSYTKKWTQDIKQMGGKEI